MNKLFVSVLVLAFGATAQAAAVSKTLKKAANASFNGFKAQKAKGQYPQSFKGDRLRISSNGKTATVAIQTFGVVGPLRIPAAKPEWHDVWTSTFKKDGRSGTWSKQGRWNELFFAL